MNSTRPFGLKKDGRSQTSPHGESSYICHLIQGFHVQLESRQNESRDDTFDMYSPQSRPRSPITPGPALPAELWLMIADDIPNLLSLVSLATTCHRLNDYLFVLLMRKAAQRPFCRVVETTVLHWASLHGHTRVVTGLLEAGAAIDDVDKEGRSALMLACMWGYEDVVQSLLAYDADLDISSGQETALTNAASCNHPGILTVLFRHGATFDRQHWWTILSAASGGYLEVVKLLLEHGADPNFQLDKFDAIPSRARPHHVCRTAIYLAVFNQHADLIALLMDKGANAEPALQSLAPKWRDLCPTEEGYLYELCGRSQSRKLWWKFCQLCWPLVSAIHKRFSNLDRRRIFLFIMCTLWVPGAVSGIVLAISGSIQADKTIDHLKAEGM
jgi:hypothetical protein